ncbi:MAG: tetratricopeptide repeat protein [Bdellovibrionales bacterium]
MKMYKAYIIFFVMCFANLSRAQISCASLLSSSAKFDVKEKMALAKRLYNEGSLIEARKTLNKILNRNPNDFRALSLRARISFSLGHLNAAERTQVEAIKAEGVYREVSHVSLAQILIARGKHKEALENLDLVLGQTPNHTTALGMKARLHLDLKEYELAYEAIMRKLDLDAYDTYALSYLVEYHYKRDQFDQALKISNRLINENKPRAGQRRIPKAYAMGLTLRAKVLTAMNGQARAALVDIYELERIYPNLHGWLLKLKAEALFKDGEFSKAVKTLVDLIKKSHEVDVFLVAALVKIEKDSNTNSIENLLGVLMKALSPKEIGLALELSRDLDWDYTPPMEVEMSPVQLRNNFWFGLHNMPIDSQTRRSTY